MARYRVEVEPAVLNVLQRMPKRDAEGILRKIAGLAEDPRPVSCEKLAGLDSYRLRSGNYRIVYHLDDSGKVITVVRGDSVYEWHRKKEKRQCWQRMWAKQSG